MGLTEAQPVTSTTSTDTDSVYWVNNVLEAPDEYGNVYRYERHGPDDAWTHVDIYENGIYKLTLDLRYASDGSLNRDILRDPDTSEWADRGYDGDITATSSGVGGGGPLDGPTQESIRPGYGSGADGRVGILSHSNCSTEWDDLVTKSFEFALGGALAGILMKKGKAISVAVAAGAALAGIRAGVALGRYGWCKTT